MRYTAKVEMEIEIDFFETDKTDDETKEEINDIIVDTFSDNSLEVIQNIFKEMKQRTNVEISNVYTFKETIED